MAHTQHCHNHAHVHGTANIATAFWLNLAFTLIEFVGGFFTNSVAILSDALHDLGDSLSLGLAWYFQKKSAKGRDATFTYGYSRFSIVGALANSLILILGSAFMLSQAIPRLLHPEEANAGGMVILALLGIAVNGAAALKLKQGNTLNERAVMLHLLEDVLGWVAVLVGSFFIYFFHWQWVDPLLSLAITCYILFNAFKNLKGVFRIILQATPEHLNAQKIESELIKLPGIEGIRDLHLWTMDGLEHIITLHAVPSADTDVEEIKAQIRRELERWNLRHVTIEIETAIKA